MTTGSTISVQDHLRGHLREYGLALSLLAITVFFQVMTDGALLRPLNLTNVILQNSYIIIMALGMLMVIVAGHIDLSVGSVSGFIGALAAVLMVQFGWHYALAVPACLLAGAAIGAVQGVFVAYLRIPSFIATLAGMLVFKGLALLILGGQSVGPFPAEFQLLSSGFIPDPFGGERLRILSLLLGIALCGVIGALRWRERVKSAAYGMPLEPASLFVARNLLLAAIVMAGTYLLASYKGIPNVLLVMVALVAMYDFVSRHTTLGRRIYALGGNEKAARLSGIRTARLTFLTFANMGMLAAIAGLVFAARLNTATPKAGTGFELDVIAACFIGGASASGGVGKVWGAVIGAFVMGVMNNGMSILGVGIDLQQVIKGVVLLAAVGLDVYGRRR
jgi:putative multiple sugar transport system permease protein